MKNDVIPPDSKFLQTYRTTASTIFEPLFKALAIRPDWHKASVTEPTIELPSGSYSLCEEGSGL
jgi:hypothetical protein